MRQKEKPVNSHQCHFLEFKVSRQSATLSTFQSLMNLRNRAKDIYSIFLEEEESCDHYGGVQSKMANSKLVTEVWIQFWLIYCANLKNKKKEQY